MKPETKLEISDAVERIVSKTELNFCGGEMSAFKKSNLRWFLVSTIEDLVPTIVAYERAD